MIDTAELIIENSQNEKITVVVYFNSPEDFIAYLETGHGEDRTRTKLILDERNRYSISEQINVVMSEKGEELELRMDE